MHKLFLTAALSAALLGACGDDDTVVPDAPVGTPDARPTPDSTPGMPDARPTPDSTPGAPDATSGTPDGGTTGDTITKIQTGVIATSATVNLQDVIVVASNTGGNYVWLAEATATGPNTGILVFFASGSTVPNPGSIVDVTGTVTEYYGMTELTTATLTDSGSDGTVPTANVVTPATIGMRNVTLVASPSCSSVTCDSGYTCALSGSSASPDGYYCGANSAEQWESVLISVSNVEVTAINGTYDFTVSNGTDSFVVDNRLFNTMTFPTVGACFNLTGILEFSYGVWKLQPRAAGDMVTSTGCL